MKNLHCRLSLGLAFALLLAFGFSEVHAQSATIAGRVIDVSTNQALPGANIIITAPGSERTLYGAATNVDGNYTLQGIPPGRYIVSARFIGYTAVQREITLEAGASRTIDFALTPGGFDLSTVVVTASRQAEKLLDAPASISVLGVREIESDVAPNTSDVLRNVVGVDMAQTGINRREIVLRGFNNAFSGQAYVLTDNRRAAVASLGVNVHSIMPNQSIDIERIEVVRGPGSALYGPGVDAGVIHYISKDPFTHPGTTVSVTGGERSFFSGQLRHAGTFNDRFGYKVTGSYTRADDWRMDLNDPLDSLQLITDVRERTYDHSAYNVNALLSYRLTDIATLTATAGHSGLNGIVLSGIGTLHADNFGYSYGQLRLTAGDFFAQLYANRNDAGESFVYGTGMSVIDKGVFYNAQAQYNWRVSPTQSLIMGIDGQLTTPDTEGSILGRNEGENILEAGIYAQSQTNVTEQFDVTVALRADYNDVVDAVRLSPRAALVYKPTTTQSLRATFNRAFSSPGTNSNFLDIRAQVTNVGGPYNLVFQGLGSASGYSFNNFRQTGTARFFMPIPQLFGQHIPVQGIPLAALYAVALAQMQQQPLPPPFDQLPPEQVEALFGVLGQVQGAVQGGTQGRLGIPDGSDLGYRTVSGPVDVEPLRQTTTQTIELGYKGALANRFVLEIDGYHTVKENFIGPLMIESPLVYVPNLGTDMTNALAPIFAGNQEIADFLASLGLTPQQAAALLGGMMGAGFNRPGSPNPVAVVQPDQAVLPGDNPNEVGGFLTYRNFGRVSFFGADVSTLFMATDNIDIFANVSWTSDNFFTADELGEDDPNLEVSLNAPQVKARLGFNARTRAGFSFGAAGRYTDGFPVRSGPYVGDIDSFFLLDVNLGYDFHRYAPGLRVDVTVQNLLDENHREFVGAPRLGRLALARLTYSL